MIMPNNRRNTLADCAAKLYAMSIQRRMLESEEKDLKDRLLPHVAAGSSRVFGAYEVTHLIVKASQIVAHQRSAHSVLHVDFAPGK